MYIMHGESCVSQFLVSNHLNPFDIGRLLEDTEIEVHGFLTVFRSF